MKVPTTHHVKNLYSIPPVNKDCGYTNQATSLLAKFMKKPYMEQFHIDQGLIEDSKPTIIDPVVWLQVFASKLKNVITYMFFNNEEINKMPGHLQDYFLWVIEPLLGNINYQELAYLILSEVDDKEFDFDRCLFILLASVHPTIYNRKHVRYAKFLGGDLFEIQLHRDYFNMVDVQDKDFKSYSVINWFAQWCDMLRKVYKLDVEVNGLSIETFVYFSDEERKNLLTHEWNTVYIEIPNKE